MKKILLILFFIITPCYAFDYSSYCSPETPAKTGSGVLMSTLGTNFLGRIIAQSEIAKALKKETNSDFKVKIDSFWGTNITQGEFSKFYAISKNYSDKNLSAQKLEVNTVCPYNKISFKNDKLSFDSNLVLKFNAEVNENNLSKILKQNVQIVNDKIVFNYKLSALGIRASMKLKAGLEVVDNKIQLCNIEFNHASLNTSKYLSMLDLTNFSVDLNKDIKANIKIDNVKIQNSLIYVTGFALIPHN